MPTMFYRLYTRRATLLRDNDEDYCTEILAVILDALNQHHPAQHAQFLRALALSEFVPSHKPVRWLTQQSRDGFRFDILGIQDAQPRIIIEVKKGRKLDSSQLEGYLSWLSKHGEGARALCSLTIDGHGADVKPRPNQNVTYVPLSWSRASAALSQLDAPHLKTLICDAQKFWEDWKMSYSAPTFAQFEITRQAAKAQASISFLLESQYADIAENIRPNRVKKGGSNRSRT